MTPSIIVGKPGSPARGPLVVFAEPPAPSVDVSSARRYGEPVYLLGAREIPPFEVCAMARAFASVLAGISFDREVDYVALTGPAVGIAVLSAVVARGGPVRFLVFDAANRRYVSCRLPGGGTGGSDGA